MNIGIDLDGVMFPFAENFQPFCEKELGRKLPPQKTFNMTTSWGLDFDQWLDLYGKFIFAKGMESDPYPRSAEAVQNLFDAGHQIHIITHRTYPDASKKLRYQLCSSTMRWLEKNNIPYHSFMLMKDKYLVNVDIMIDDAIHNLEAFQRYRPRTELYCISQPWNKGFKIKKRFSSIYEASKDILQK